MAQKKLAAYQAKRDFKKTPEPRGKASIRAAEYPRFVIQKHAATRLHYDLRLEHDGRVQVLGGDQGSLARSAQTSDWPSRSRTIRSITATSKAPSRRASTAAAR